MRFLEAEISEVVPGGGLETVLVVEDDEQVRRLVCRLLAEAGYTVLEAVAGTEALGVAQRHDGPIDLLLTDVVMPEMGAEKLLGQLLPLRPGLRVVLMSGYVEDTIADPRFVHENVVFLQKPFTAGALLALVRETLGER